MVSKATVEVGGLAFGFGFFHTLFVQAALQSASDY